MPPDIKTGNNGIVSMVVLGEAAERECARAEGVGSGERKARTAKGPQGAECGDAVA